MANYVAVDWGTTSFRLWLIGEKGTIIGESRSREGMTTARETGFAAVLDKHLAEVGAPDDAPVIMCGMVGAKQGWVEAGYIDVPARLTDISGAAVGVPGLSRDVRILPGLAQRDVNSADVMRGEETQLLGCAEKMKSSDCLIAMPGTHSKWVRVVRQEVLGFSTFMTGELFDVISEQSILQHAVKDSAGFDGANPTFLAALHAAYKEPELATNRLFSIRARGLLFSLAPTDAEATLSGMMIGLELAGALKQAPKDTPVILVASGKLRGLYEAAFHRLGIQSSTIDADDAVRRGLSQAARDIWQFDEGAAT
ncbi:MAG: 2-dehydro-3-deoxygalactonokinase [Rhizobium sp.]|nr:2-dehydro-3-deoxygalactonokinase [Rhizobium sp.]